LVDAAFALGTMGISEPLELEEGYYLLQVTDRVAATVPPLETVEERVKADVTQQLQDEAAKADAESCLAALRQGQSLAETAAAFNIEPMETGFFKRTGTIPQIGYEPGIIETAFGLRDDQSLPEEVLQGRNGWYVIQLKARKLPDEEGFGAEKANLMEQLPEQKKQGVFQQWLADLKSRGRIEIEEKLIQ
jgi:peptidyl-prolyl cis-trans isomerase D